MRKAPFLHLLSLCWISSISCENVVNKEVVRMVDLSEHVVRHVIDVQLENEGPQPAHQYLLALEAGTASKLAAVSATAHGIDLEVSQATGSQASEGHVHFSVSLAEGLGKGQNLSLQIKMAFSRVLQPLPARIAQNEAQLMRYQGNHYFVSPYTTTKQSTTVKLPSQRIESRSDEPPSTVKGDVIEYGPYPRVDPYKSSEMSIHFESNGPFVTFSNSQKEVVVSHWGDILVEESVVVHHTGARLKGVFSRYDFARDQKNYGVSAVTSLVAMLPGSAKGIYYRDEAGNISTSSVRYGPESTMLTVQPRFPLFGGWNYSFLIGYKIPANLFISSGAGMVLRVPFGTSFQTAHADSHVVRITLPKGTTDIQVVTSVKVDQSRDKTLNFMDTSGCPVIVLKKLNVVGEHQHNLEIHYKASFLAYVFEPAVWITALILALSVLAASRGLDFADSRLGAATFTVKGLERKEKS